MVNRLNEHFGSRNTLAEILWAVSLASYLMAQVDGVLSDDEIDAMVRGVVEMAGDPETSPDDIATLFARHQEFVDEFGFDRAASELSQRLTTDELREATLIMAGTIAAIDGKFTAEETDAFEALAEAIGFTPEQTAVFLARVTARA